MASFDFEIDQVAADFSAVDFVRVVAAANADHPDFGFKAFAEGKAQAVHIDATLEALKAPGGGAAGRGL
jgi:hypothetical protein